MDKEKTTTMGTEDTNFTESYGESYEKIRVLLCNPFNPSTELFIHYSS